MLQGYHTKCIERQENMSAICSAFTGEVIKYTTVKRQDFPFISPRTLQLDFETKLSSSVYLRVSYRPFSVLIIRPAFFFSKIIKFVNLFCQVFLRLLLHILNTLQGYDKGNRTDGIYSP